MKSDPGPGRPTGRRKRAAGTPARPGGPQRGKGKPSGPAWPLIRRLASYVRIRLGLFAATVIAAVAAAAFELLPPWVVRLVIDRFVLEGRPELIWWGAAGLVGVSVMQGSVDFLRLYLTALLGHSIVFRIRNSVFEQLNRLSFSFYDRARTGDLMSRVTADTEVLSQFFGRAGVIVLTNALFLLGVLGVLFSWNWRLGLIYLAIAPLMMLAIRVYAARVQPVMGRVRRALGDLGSALQATLANIVIVKIFGREEFEEKRFDRASDQYLTASLESVKIQSLWMPFVNVLMGFGMGLVLWLGGYSVIQGAVTLGTLVAFTTYINMLLRPVRQTGMMTNIVMRSLAAAERIFEVLDTEPDIKDAPGAYALPPIAGKVEFAHVSFAYDGQNPVLHDVSLQAEPGELVAIVGPSGAGKSTLVHLLPRLYDVQKGSITLDGHDVRAVTVASLRRQIGIALQNVFLFDTTVRENIAYGSPDAADATIEQVARDVCLHDFIASLPLGYGTPVGERGVRLSGGQKQRLALARVLLTQPRVLILDEPTSSVDAETERQMQQAFERARAGRTTFVIAHRLWTVQHADQIVVLDAGHLVEHARTRGVVSAHQQLMEKEGLYSQTYALQFAGETQT